MDGGEGEASASKQTAVLDFAALAASGHYEHVQVEDLARRRLIPGRHHKFYEQNPALGWYRLANIPKNGHGGRIVPVVNHLLQDISAGAPSHRFKQSAPHHVPPFRKPLR